MEFEVDIHAMAPLNGLQVRASNDAFVLTQNHRQWLDPYIDRKCLLVESNLLAWNPASLSLSMITMVT